MPPRYPHLHLTLVGEDGNAFFILSRLNKVLRDGGVSAAEREAIAKEATSGDYDHLLRTVMATVETD